MRVIVAVAYAAITVLSWREPDAWASWPMARADNARTGAVSGSSNITRPTPYWRTYLGGPFGAGQLLAQDVNGDGVPDLLFAQGGKVTARTAAADVLWQTELKSIGALITAADLDGDGTPEIVATAPTQVFAFSLSGAIVWQEPAGEIGALGALRVGDVNGDGVADLVIQGCGCCAITGTTTGVVYSFPHGFGAPVTLGSLPLVACAQNTLTLIDMAGTGTKQILTGDNTGFALLDGNDESILASTNGSGDWHWMDDNQCYPANLDGVPGDEAVCIENDSDYPQIGQRRVTALRYDSAASPPSLSVLWSNVLAADDGGNLTWVDPVEDLDGDGEYEIVISSSDATNGLRLHILDALTGADLVSPVSGATAAGVAQMQAAGKYVVLTFDGTATTGWSFVRTPTPSLTAEWSASAAAPLSYPSASRLTTMGGPLVALATDLNGDGLADVVAHSTRTLVGLSGAGGSLARIASFKFPAATGVRSAWIVPPITTNVPQVALARTDGLLNLMGGNLQPTSAGSPPGVVALPTGGTFATGAWRELYWAPRVAALGSGPVESVLVPDSRPALHRFDASAASWAVPPVSMWEVEDAYAPDVVMGLDGSNPGVACLTASTPLLGQAAYSALAIDAGGHRLWSAALPGIPLSDLAPGTFSLGGSPDFAIQIGNSSNVDLTTIALSGQDGSTLWSNGPFFPGIAGAEVAGLSTGPFNGDALDDVYFQGGATFVLSGASGAAIGSGGPTYDYALPVLYDTTGAGANQVVLTATGGPVALYSSDLTSALWTSPRLDDPFPYPGVASCPGTPPLPVLVEGSWAYPARLKFAPLAGASLGQFTTIVLAGGKRYPGEAKATADGAYLGQLTAANVHSNLTGTNHPTAVVGSTDGWLYGVNACTGALDFAVNVGSPVGEAVFGDTDGDGLDEILATAADGYLYDYKDFAIAAPSYVWDTDPPAIPNRQVDTVVTTNELSATWGAVAGATGYAVQVVTPTGNLVSTPSWQDVGVTRSTTLHGLPLTNGARYLFAVRALSKNGPSVDAISPGVTVYFPDAGAPDGGSDALSDGAVTDSDASADSGGVDSSVGAMDGGFSPHDASAADAAQDGSSTTGGGGGGCGCLVAGTGAGASGLGAAALPLALAVRRRRRDAGDGRDFSRRCARDIRRARR